MVEHPPAPSSPPSAASAPDAAPRAGSLARQGVAFWIGPLIAVDLSLLVAAWFLPLMTLKAGCMFWDAMCLSRDETSIADTVRILAESREWLLLFVVGGFAMLFPVAKLVVAGWVWARVDATSPGRSRAFAVMQALGKWSMIDVFVVALIVVGVKVSLISDVDVHAGIYVFTVAVALSIVVMTWIEKRLKPLLNGNHPTP
jgi:paraquat-inducible protein A